MKSIPLHKEEWKVDTEKRKIPTFCQLHITHPSAQKAAPLKMRDYLLTYPISNLFCYSPFIQRETSSRNNSPSKKRSYIAKDPVQQFSTHNMRARTLYIGSVILHVQTMQTSSRNCFSVSSIIFLFI